MFRLHIPLTLFLLNSYPVLQCVPSINHIILHARNSQGGRFCSDINITSPYIRIRVKLIWLLLFSSCLSPFDFPTENIGGRVVISGQISPLQEQSIVQLGLTAAQERLPFPVSGATVTLFDDANESRAYEEDPLSPGSYLLATGLGIPGRTYHIQVIMPTGEVYESVPEKMPDVVGELTTSYEISFEEFTDFEGAVSNQPFVKIYSNTILPSTPVPTYLKWSVEEAFLLSPTDFPDIAGYVPPPCFIVQNADPQTIALFNGAELKTTMITNLLIGSRLVDWTFLEKHYFNSYQSSLTIEAYEYWRKVNIVSNHVGSIFDTPPAEITGNIQRIDNPADKVLGYFQATNQTYDRIVLLPFNLPFPLLMETCTYDPNKFQYLQRCLNCLTVRNSSYRRPEWF